MAPVRSFSVRVHDAVGYGSRNIARPEAAVRPSNVDYKLLANNKQDGGTRVNWAMHGPLGLMQRVMHIFFNMEKMVGPDFERGLANMKALAEK